MSAGSRYCLTGSGITGDNLQRLLPREHRSAFAVWICVLVGMPPRLVVTRIGWIHVPRGRVRMSYEIGALVVHPQSIQRICRCNRYTCWRTECHRADEGGVIMSVMSTGGGLP